MESAVSPERDLDPTHPLRIRRQHRGLESAVSPERDLDGPFHAGFLTVTVLESAVSPERDLDLRQVLKFMQKITSWNRPLALRGI